MFKSVIFKKFISVTIIVALLLTAVVICEVGIQKKAQASPKLGNISFLRPGFSTESLKSKDSFNQALASAIREYEKRYGGKVKIVFADWNSWQTKIIAMMAAGDPVDVIFGNDGTFPYYYLNGIAQPLDKYVNLKAPYINKIALERVGVYNGKHYLACDIGSASHTILTIYNKDLMLEEGIDENEMPLALYKKGKWNWDTFAALAKKLTADTNKDGKIDRYGVNVGVMEILYSNGATLVTVDKQGKGKLNFDSSAVQRALNFYKKGIKEGWMADSWDYVVSGLEKRQIAMLVGVTWDYDGKRTSVEDELEVAPIPLGPDNKKGLYHFIAHGYCISKGSKNPIGAGKYIDLLLESINNMGKNTPPAKRRPKYVDDLVDKMMKTAYYPGSPDSLLFGSQKIYSWDISGKINSSDSVASALASLRPQAEKIVKEASSGSMVKPVYRPFKPFTLNFEDGKIDKVKSPDPNKKTVKLSIASGKEAIKGKSLKVTWDEAKDGTEIYVVTVPEKIKIYGWHDYKVSFDVKVLKAPKAGKTTVVCSILSEPKANATSYGNITKTIDRGQTVYHVEGNITNIADNSQNMCLRIGIKEGADFVIDNIKVEELK